MALGALVQKLDMSHDSHGSHDAHDAHDALSVSDSTAGLRYGSVQMGGEVLFPAGLRLQVRRRGAVSQGKAAWITHQKLEENLNGLKDKHNK